MVPTAAAAAPSATASEMPKVDEGEADADGGGGGHGGHGHVPLVLGVVDLVTEREEMVAHLLGVLGGLGAVSGELRPGSVEGPAAVAGPLHRGDGAVDVGEGAVDLLGELVPVMAAPGHRPTVSLGADGEAEDRLLLQLLAAAPPGRLCAIRHGRECYRVSASVTTAWRPWGPHHGRPHPDAVGGEGAEH
jgi:hypothetical protein